MLEQEKGSPVPNDRTIEELLQSIAASKAELDHVRPLSPSLLAAIRRPYDVELTYTSNAIEGNTLTLRETKEVIEHGVTVAGKSLKDHLEAQDHHYALEYLYDLAGRDEPILERTVRELHSLVVKRSQSDIAGRYSPNPHAVQGSATVFPSPLKVPELMEAFGRDLRTTGLSPREAFDAHFRLTAIHPFADGNGRTARLLMNLILVRGGHRPVAVRTQDRGEYLDALETASVKGDHSPFQKLMHRHLADTMSAYVGVLKETHANQTALDEQKGLTPAELAYLQRRGRGRG